MCLPDIERLAPRSFQYWITENPETAYRPFYIYIYSVNVKINTDQFFSANFYCSDFNLILFWPKLWSCNYHSNYYYCTTIVNIKEYFFTICFSPDLASIARHIDTILHHAKSTLTSYYITAFTYSHHTISYRIACMFRSYYVIPQVHSCHTTSHKT